MAGNSVNGVGVTGNSTHANAILGTSSNGVGVYGSSVNATGVFAAGATALTADGPVEFSTSGIATVTKGTQSVTVSLASATNFSIVLATIQQDRAGITVQSAASANGSFTYGEPPDPPAVEHLLDALTRAASPSRPSSAPARARKPR